MKSWYEHSGPAHLAAHGYAGIASPGGAYQTDRNNVAGDNPMVYYGRLKDTQAQMKWSRRGNQTIYEFAVQIYDRFPQLHQLTPGKRIGFDAVVADMDLHEDKVTDHAAWIPFGKREGGKYFNASSLAVMVFLADTASLGSITGQLVAPDNKVATADLVVEAWQGMLPGGEAHCDADGTFIIHLPAGRYTLRPKPGQGIAPFEVEIDVIAGRRSRLIDDTVECVPL